MTFAVSSTNSSGAIGGINQSTKPNIDTDSTFDKILDSRVEKRISEKRRNKSQQFKTKQVYDLKTNDSSFKKSSKEIAGNDDAISKDQKNLAKSADDRIAKLKKLAKEIKEGDGIDEKDIEKLKDELDILIESLLSTESELTHEELLELSTFLGQIDEVFLAVEGKLENLLSKVTASGETNQTILSQTTTNNEVEKQMFETVENLRENISKIEELISKSLNASDESISKTEFNKLLTEISNDMDVVSENTEKILENNPGLLKETVKNTDTSTEVEKTQVSDEMKAETELKATTVVKNDDMKSLGKSKDQPSDTDSKIVKVDETSNEETLKTEEISTEKNIEILKFENTLIRSAKVNNPAKAQTFEKNIMKQVINHTASNLNILENGSEMILKLYPKNLGEVAVKLAIDKGIVIAEFNVESQTVKEVLESNLSDLRTALLDKGLALEGLDVSVGDNGTNSNSGQSQQGSKSKNKFFEILEVEEEILNSNTLENSTTIDTLK